VILQEKKKGLGGAGWKVEGRRNDLTVGVWDIREKKNVWGSPVRSWRNGNVLRGVK